MLHDRATRTFLDSGMLSRLAAVPLLARRPMVGGVSGRHTSPHRGSSVEFAEYRKYVPGDDLRRLDWRVYGRTDRNYVKEYEADTNLRLCLVVDSSGSMNYGSTGTTRIEFARRIAGTLAGEYPYPGSSRYWFGTVSANPAGGPEGVDFNTGLLTPYLEGNVAVYQCPSFGPGQVDTLTYGTMCSGYDYNPSLGPGTVIGYDANYTPKLEDRDRRFKLASVRETQRTIVFADSAQVRYDLKFLENLGGLVPPSGNFPTVHFRHATQANVCFLDGHVESRPWMFAVDVPGDTWLTAEQAALMERKKLGFVCDGEPRDPATRDALYDRD